MTIETKEKCANWMNTDAIRETVRQHQEKWGSGDTDDIPYDLSDVNIVRNCSLCDFGGTGSPFFDQVARVLDEQTTRLQDFVKQVSGSPMKRLCFKERR